MMNKQEWRPVPEYEQLYEVSNFGLVRKADGTPMNGNINSYGYDDLGLLLRNGKNGLRLYLAVCHERTSRRAVP